MIQVRAQPISAPFCGAYYIRYSTGGTVPDKVTVKLGALTESDLDQTLSDHIEAVKGRHIAGDQWEIPTASMLAIVQRSDVFHATLAQNDPPAGHAQLNDTLNDVTAAITAGIPASAAAQYAMYVRNDHPLVVVIAPNVATAASVQKWLEEQKVYVPEHQLTAESNNRKFVLLLPADKVTPLVAKFASVELRGDTYAGSMLPMTRGRWPQDSLELEKSVIEPYLPPEPKFYSHRSTPVPPTPSAAYLKAINDNRTLAKARHNLQTWHDKGYKGDVKVGIIDWAFTDYKDIDELGTFTYTKDPTKTNTTHNMLCQDLDDGSIVPWPDAIMAVSRACEPIGGTGLKPLRHGVHVAELVKGMAPEATLLLAQANSPMQVYTAAKWLKAKGAQVIVHAAGWPYDSPGNGDIYFPISTYNNRAMSDKNHPNHYYPSPLATVEEITKNNGPVWINAAGNHEEWTMWFDEDDIVDDEDSEYYGYVIFDDSRTLDMDKTCQEMPITAGETAYYSMRWDDTWPAAKQKLDYHMIHTKVSGNYKSTNYGSSATTIQNTSNYPFRRSSHYALSLLDLCLRIQVHDLDKDDDESPTVPNWIQFQALVSKGLSHDGPDWEDDTTGRSIVNPSESVNDGLLAIGAASLRETSIKITDYSSRGPVFNDSDTLSDGDPSRSKPDVVASTDGATLTKWKHKCGANSKSVSSCGKDLYFTGTSGATSHTGGIAAVVADFLESANALHEPDDVANFIRDTATSKGNVYTWGKGFIDLPCPSEGHKSDTFSVDSEEWEDSDCIGYSRGFKSDFHTFYLDRIKTVTITLESDDRDAYIKLREGAHSEGDILDVDNDNDDDSSAFGTDARLVKKLDKGAYTIEATTNLKGSVGGSYDLDVSSVVESASLTQAPYARYNRWAGFRVKSTVPVDVVVNHTGTRRLKVATNIPTRTGCPATRGQSVQRSSGQYVYFAGCSVGTAYIQLKGKDSGEVLKTYRIRVRR